MVHTLEEMRTRTPADLNEAAPEAIMLQAAWEALLRDAVQGLRPLYTPQALRQWLQPTHPQAWAIGAPSADYIWPGLRQCFINPSCICLTLTGKLFGALSRACLHTTLTAVRRCQSQREPTNSQTHLQSGGDLRCPDLGQSAWETACIFHTHDMYPYIIYIYIYIYIIYENACGIQSIHQTPDWVPEDAPYSSHDRAYHYPNPIQHLARLLGDADSRAHIQELKDRLQIPLYHSALRPANVPAHLQKRRIQLLREQLPFLTRVVRWLACKHIHVPEEHTRCPCDHTTPEDWEHFKNCPLHTGRDTLVG